ILPLFHRLIIRLLMKLNRSLVEDVFFFSLHNSPYLIIFASLKTCFKFEYTSLEDRVETEGLAMTIKSIVGSIISFISKRLARIFRFTAFRATALPIFFPTEIPTRK